MKISRLEDLDENHFANKKAGGKPALWMRGKVIFRESISI
jgi:hypothetical protein